MRAGRLSEIHPSYKVDPTAHLGLVYYVVRLFLKQGRTAHGMTVDDMVQVGNLGLCIAAQRYDVTRGSFVGFARSVIERHIGTALSATRRVGRFGGISTTQRLLRGGVHGHTDSDRVRRLVTSPQAHKTYTTDAQVAAAKMFGGGPELSLNTTRARASEGPSSAVQEQDRLPDEQHEGTEELLGNKELTKALQSFREGLGSRERSLLDARVLADEDEQATLQELGGRWSVTRECVRLWELALVRKLRRFCVVQGVCDAGP